MKGAVEASAKVATPKNQCWPATFNCGQEAASEGRNPSTSKHIPGRNSHQCLILWVVSQRPFGAEAAIVGFQ
ncbi:hypothetical protein CRG98_012615 [Punica granatum]|uniref:Uncharacterized protein n=1 Tax=Punica granatum TaxID=22663 RepID=A0A2I0KGN0_PUNGR|nr:hypothetical protein CRG98_012615 [Punica granatum]